MPLHRLFVALRPPAVTRALLAGLMGGVTGARWQDDAQLHCTLRFVGEVDRHQAEDIAAALGAVRSEALALSLGPAGTFDRKGRVDTLWIGVQPRAAVAALHDRVDLALRRVGVAPDDRAFVPHITIARFSRSDAPGPEVASAIAPPVAHHFEVRHFELFESHLGAEGAIYETVARYPLG
ncbi:RNA 2',3'-cyclic phosphodiesterase [Sphingomonas sp. CGMCC 1.13654]|uniref:RNA 2',3'-cyclic phosphodiesterase n=1 Tax=Sphingomonas chungangi TaxID=2683589 RepID=A0A838L1D0_9SPHN|nr:RNA 2',3'-cyclic phosphodiesterase [Sphingomonas chungangi]MBA2932994.1 RNA 2',3'-cyclic phosphodiesterase [Sphingomonas chungangi]MVW56614.1 RNA 2',3'-cyclic phosphodiesterase [Sphingomonas chungangi]